MSAASWRSTPQDTLTAQIVEQELAGSAVSPPVGGSSDSGDLGEAVERYLTRYFSSFGNELPPVGSTTGSSATSKSRC